MGSNSSALSPGQNMVTLKTKEGVEVVVEEKVALQSDVIKKSLTDVQVGSNKNFPLPNVKAAILTHIIEYCTKHAHADDDDEQLKQWDQDFIQRFDKRTVFKIFRASYYMDIKSLQDLTVRRMCNRSLAEILQ